MKNIKLICIYIIFIQMLLSTCTSIPKPWSLGFQSMMLVVPTMLLVLVFISDNARSPLWKYSIGYCLLVVASFALYNIEEMHLVYMYRWVAPVLFLCVVKPDDYIKLKPLFYVLIVFFICNAGIALYERLTLTRLFEVDEKNDVLYSQMTMMSEEYGDHSFRAFAICGHPLTNANIMAFMSFMIYYCTSITRKYRIGLFFLGIASLFAFNARGAMAISLLLCIPILFDIFKESRYRIASILVIGIAVYYFVINFETLGGRLAYASYDDHSGMVRILAIQEFLSLSLDEWIWGGHTVMYGENGYLILLERYGLIIGLGRIVLECYLCYHMLNIDEKKAKWIIFLTLVLIGNTNNNLYFPVVAPFYMLCAMFVLNYSSFRKESVTTALA